jgi:hypothetical protein
MQRAEAAARQLARHGTARSNWSKSCGGQGLATKPTVLTARSSLCLGSDAEIAIMGMSPVPHRPVAF